LLPIFIQKIASGPGLPGEGARGKEGVIPLRSLLLSSLRPAWIVLLGEGRCKEGEEGMRKKGKKAKEGWSPIGIFPPPGNALPFPYATRPHGRLPKPPPPKSALLFDEKEEGIGGGRASLSLWITVCEVGSALEKSTEYNYPPSSEPLAPPHPFSLRKKERRKRGFLSSEVVPKEGMRHKRECIYAMGTYI
jgi:hypothetical protein